MTSKNTFHLSLLLLSALILPGCSFFTNKVEALVTADADLANKTNPADKFVKKNLFCFGNSKINLLLEDESTVKYYQPLIPVLFETKKYSFVQKAAMLSLIEMSRRPDEASPSARLQFYLRLNNTDYYFDLRPLDLGDDTKMPYLKGVQTLIKNFDSSKSILNIAETLDSVLPPNMDVSPEFENFLLSNRNELLKNEYLSEAFFKGDEVLTKHESFKRINIKKLISSFNAEKLSSDAFYTATANPLALIDATESDLELKCNIDINKERFQKEEATSSASNKAHYFALKEGSNYFIAVSSTVIQKPFKNYQSTYFIKSKASSSPLPICQFKNKMEDIVLFSTSGRNPEQHLKHLISYDINQVDSFLTLSELLNFPRHLFLNDPDRILYESKRGRKSQLDLFLTMNFPIYHVEALGDIIGMASLKNKNRDDKTLVVDDRSQSRIWCGP